MSPIGYLSRIASSIFKMKSTIITTLFCLFTAILALPAYLTDTAAAQGKDQISKRAPSGTFNTIQIVPLTKDISNPGAGNPEIVTISPWAHALVKFSIPREHQDQQHVCKFVLQNPIEAVGLRLATVWSLNSANIDNAAFDTNPLRDQFLGTLSNAPGEISKVVDGPGTGFLFPCPGGEVAYDIATGSDGKSFVTFNPGGIVMEVYG
jgi:hypothetical protein